MKTVRQPAFQSLKKAFRLAQDLCSMPQLSYDDIIEQYEKATLNRRQFLKNASAISLSTIGTELFASSDDSIFSKLQPRIAIVGGGMAGLTAGFYLKKKGIKATIFEADKRVGGRIRSTHKFGNSTLTTEIGAEFIDSHNKDMIYLAQMLGLWKNPIDVTKDTFGIKETFFFDGELRHIKEVVFELSAVMPQMMKDSYAIGTTYQTPRAKVLDNISMMEYVENLPLSRWMKNGLYSIYLGEQGLDSYALSSINLLEVLNVEASKQEVRFFGDSDERFKIKGGNQQIPNKLAALMEPQIRTEHRLIAIREHQNSQLTLTFNQNGTTIDERFDAIILCIPFTILRGVDFNMNLPNSKRLAINELAYGDNTKVVMEFKERVWRQSNYQGYLFNNDIHNGWDSTHEQTQNKGYGTYTALLGGETARKADRKNLESISQDCITVLDKVFKGASTNYTRQSELANWTQNPFALGSYSSFGIGQYTTLSGKAAEPVRNVYFAGEHCSNEFWGFMNGAAETGRLAAERILKKHRF